MFVPQFLICKIIVSSLNNREDLIYIKNLAMSLMFGGMQDTYLLTTGIRTEVTIFQIKYP